MTVSVIYLRTKETGSGRKYEAAEYFSYDQWWSTDIHTDRDIRMVERMATDIGAEIKDQREGK